MFLFKKEVFNVKPLLQDKTIINFNLKKKTKITSKKMFFNNKKNNFYFSDEFQPILKTSGPVKYLRSDINSYEIKKLQRGYYKPEIFLDLHGLTQKEAKKELGALIIECQNKHICCACIIHGHGKDILKQKTPLWLAQHPRVIGFYQAPKKFGGSAAKLILIELLY